MTQFFAENGSFDVYLLESLGMDNVTSRMLLVDYIQGAFRYPRADLDSAFTEFIQCLRRTITERATCKRVVDDLTSRVSVLEGNLQEMDEVRSHAQILETRSSQLSVINDQLKEALAAHKGIRSQFRRDIAEKDSIILTLRSEMAEHDKRIVKCLADASSVESSFASKLMGLKMLNSKRKQLFSLREKSFKRRISWFEKHLEDLNRKWKGWRRNSSLVGARCGCKASVRYYRESGIDLEWVTAQAELASVAYQKELGGITESMRMQIQTVRMAKDDALADCGVYIDRLLQAGEELRSANLQCASLLGELSIAKASLAKRVAFDKGVFRSQLFTDAGGSNIICPVPTMDGNLVPLSAVYSGWMRGTGGGVDGIEAKFICPVTGLY